MKINNMLDISLFYFVCWIFVIIPRQVSSLDVNLPTCTESYQQYDGYAYHLEGSAKYWSHCGFPNPLLDQSSCGREYDRSRKYYHCDPDRVISESVSLYIDSYLYNIAMDTPYQCTNEYNQQENFTMILVTVDNIQVPDLESNETCINNCQRIYPQLDEGIRSGTSEEYQLGLDVFVEGLLGNYNNEDCGNVIVIAYWKQKEMMATAAGSAAKKLLDMTEVNQIMNRTLQEYLIDQDYKKGFEYLTDQYKILLIGTITPAVILIFIQAGIALLVLAFLILQLTQPPGNGYFDDGLAKTVFRYFLYIITGIWFFEHLILCLIKLEAKLKPWHASIPFILFIAGVVGLFYIETGSDAGSSSSNVTVTN